MYICNCAGITERDAKLVLASHSVEELIESVPCITKSCARCFKSLQEIRKTIVNDKEKNYESSSKST